MNAATMTHLDGGHRCNISWPLSEAFNADMIVSSLDDVTIKMGMEAERLILN